MAISTNETKYKEYQVGELTFKIGDEVTAHKGTDKEEQFKIDGFEVIQNADSFFTVIFAYYLKDTKKVLFDIRSLSYAKNVGGRPLKFETVEELEKKIQAYFESCYEDAWEDIYKRDENGNRLRGVDGKYLEVPKKIKKQIKPFTITGLAVALDTTRETLLDYENKDGFSDTIKKAKEFIQSYTEECLFGNSVTGVIFNLKNNYGWKDRQELTGKDGKDLIPEENTQNKADQAINIYLDGKRINNTGNNTEEKAS